MSGICRDVRYGFLTAIISPLDESTWHSVMSKPDYLPNMGRPPGRLGPIGISWLFADPDKILRVQLVVIRLKEDAIYHPVSRDQHWMITWNIGTTDDGHVVHRRLNTVHEFGVDHLTNWGAVTTAADDEISSSGVVITLTDMTLEQRQLLEEIADLTEVRQPDGNWNCQSWCQSVLEEAVQKGLAQSTEVDIALKAARAVIPLPM